MKQKYHKEFEDDDKDDTDNNTTNINTITPPVDKEKEQHQQQEKEAQQNALVAAVGIDDIFSRLDAEITKKQNNTNQPNNNNGKEWMNHIKKKNHYPNQYAIGQFDLVSTTNTERGHKLLLSDGRDLHPHVSSMDGISKQQQLEKQSKKQKNSNQHKITPANASSNSSGNNKGSRVIDKYNRHWAMVLHPEDATAGCDLTTVARKSVFLSLEDNDDAKVGGGSNAEMKRLVNFANAKEGRANHVMGLGDDEDNDNGTLYQDLKLHNVEVYKTGGTKDNNNGNEEVKRQQEMKRKLFGQQTVNQVKEVVLELHREVGLQNKIFITDPDPKKRLTMMIEANENKSNIVVFPKAKFGYDLLGALTKRMAMDSQTESEALKMTNSLPQDFKNKIHTYCRRSSELLRR